MKISLYLFVIFGFLFITGCQSDAISAENVTIPISTSEISPLQTPKSEGTDMSDPTINPDPQAQNMIQLAKESLARKFKISEDQIYVSSCKAIVWPDASLGCPQSGIVYTQVLTPGFQVLLEAIGKSFSYHTDGTERVILCDVRPPNEIFLPP